MTATYEPPTDITAENGAIFRYKRTDDGGIQVWILNAQQELLAGFPLTADDVIEIFNELDFCEHCGQPLGADWPKHGPGRCSNPDDPGGLGD